MRLALAFTLLVSPALADVKGALSGHVLPGFARLAETTQSLADTAASDCRPSAITPFFHSAYDAWIMVSHLGFGPIEDEALELTMAFWPDPRDRVGKALSRLSRPQDPAVDDPAAFAEVSAVAQGFTALERLLFDAQANADYACRLTRAIATALARNSVRLHDVWPEFATLMETAGAPGNARFQSYEEAQRALYTALSTGLEFLEINRLGRPLGTYDRPRPRRAEAHRSSRSMRHVRLALGALEELSSHIAIGATPRTSAAFADARNRAAALSDDALSAVNDPQIRFRVEVLQQAVREVRVAVVAEIGFSLEISPGFSSLDGD